MVPCTFLMWCNCIAWIMPYLKGNMHMTSDELINVLADNYCMLYNRAYRICGNSFDAEDAVQTACLKAWEHHRDVMLEKTCLAWMYTIVRHESLSILRKRSKLTRDKCIEMFGKDKSSPEDLAGYWYIMQNVSLLPPSCRQVFLLRYDQGYPVNAIAHQLCTPRGTISSRLRRAKQNLRRTLVQTSSD